MRLSLIIPAKDKNDPKLADLLRSIEAQDFDKKQMETLVITEGTSESAKAIGIRRATGEIIGILASDNILINKDFLNLFYWWAKRHGAAYPAYYACVGDGLNRYFSLIGGNDPLAYYMGKNDRLPFLKRYSKFCSCGKSLGDNGFFIRREMILETDLENYYHIDNANEAHICAMPCNGQIVHDTGGNIFKFFAKRYRYGLQHAFNKNRRWHLVDFRQVKDILRLLWFVLCTLTLLQPLWISFKGYKKIQDVAWFLHPVVCLATFFTYTALIIHLGLKQLFQSLYVRMEGQTA